MTRLIQLETRVGPYYEDYDRHVVDVAAPLFAVIDSECDNGQAGDALVRTLTQAARQLATTEEPSPDAVERRLVAALREANEAIRSTPRGAPGYGGGAAVTAVAFADGVMVVAHVGDCRLYLEEPGGWVPRTREQSLLEAYRAQGVTAGDAAEGRWQAGVVMQAVGVTTPLAIETLRVPLSERRHVLLCSPGAWRPLDPEYAAEPLPASVGPSEIAQFVMARHARDGERDNATVIVAELGGDRR